MMPESELMSQARRALREGRLDDAQGFLVTIVVREPVNDEAWVLLADALKDPERKMECLERARRIDPRNPATLKAIQDLQNEIGQSAFKPQTPVDVPAEAAAPVEPPNRAELASPLLEHADTLVHSIMMSVEPTATRNLGLELVHQIGLAIRYDEIRSRRWARSVGRDALVKYEKALSVLITNLPQNDPQLALLREQRLRTLEMLK